jgi:hypothetical protein
MEATLQETMDNGQLQFHGEQRQAIEAIQAGDSPVVAVIATAVARACYDVYWLRRLYRGVEELGGDGRSSHRV